MKCDKIASFFSRRKVLLLVLLLLVALALQVLAWEYTPRKVKEHKTDMRFWVTFYDTSRPNACVIKVNYDMPSFLNPVPTVIPIWVPCCEIREIQAISTDGLSYRLRYLLDEVPWNCSRLDHLEVRLECYHGEVDVCKDLCCGIKIITISAYNITQRG